MTPFCESQHQLEPGLLEESTKFAITNTTISHDYYNARRRQWHPTPVLLPGKSPGRKSLVGCSPWDRWELDTTERLHFHFSLHELEKEMATHSHVLAWRIPRMGEPVGLPSMGSHRVEHDWSDLAAAATSSLIQGLSLNRLNVWQIKDYSKVFLHYWRLS